MAAMTGAALAGGWTRSTRAVGTATDRSETAAFPFAMATISTIVGPHPRLHVVPVPQGSIDGNER